MSGKEVIHYRVLVPSDLKETLRVYETSMTDAPAFKLLGLKVPNDTFRLADKFLPSVLSNGLSIGAFDARAGQIVGISLCSVINPHHIDITFFDISDPETRVLATLEKLFKQATEGLDLFRGENEIVKFSGIGVIKEFRQQGITTRLVEEVITLITLKGYRRILMEAGNVYSRRIAEKFKFQLMNQIAFTDFIDKGESMYVECREDQKYDSIYRLEL